MEVANIFIGRDFQVENSLCTLYKQEIVNSFKTY